MKLTYVPKGEKTAMPVPGKSGWCRGEVDEESILINFDDVAEKVNGGSVVSVADLEEIIKSGRDKAFADELAREAAEDAESEE